MKKNKLKSVQLNSAKSSSIKESFEQSLQKSAEASRAQQESLMRLLGEQANAADCASTAPMISNAIENARAESSTSADFKHDATTHSSDAFQDYRDVLEKTISTAQEIRSAAERLENSQADVEDCVRVAPQLLSALEQETQESASSAEVEMEADAGD